jgi:hypothetical protein
MYSILFLAQKEETSMVGTIGKRYLFHVLQHKNKKDSSSFQLLEVIYQPPKLPPELTPKPP